MLYDDETAEQQVLFDGLDGWTEHDIRGDLDAAKKLVAIRIWGYKSTAPLADISIFDDFSFCRAR